MTAPLYRISNLRYGYDFNNQNIEVLKGVDLELPHQSFSCFVGPSGTGKTTLLNLLGLIDKPKAGEIILDGVSTSQLDEKDLENLRLRKIGFVFQSFHLIPTLSVLENTTYFLPLLGYGKKEAELKGSELLARLGLSENLHKFPSQLSGGQRQRVAIARAIVKDPLVVLADEPTANLDSETAQTIIETFQYLQKEKGTSFIFSTHDPRLVDYASEVYSMNNGLISKGGV